MDRTDTRSTVEAFVLLNSFIVVQRLLRQDILEIIVFPAKEQLCDGCNARGDMEQSKIGKH